MVNLSKARKERLVRSLAHLFEAQYDRAFVEQRIILFTSNEFTTTFAAILESGNDVYSAESQSTVLNTIAKLADWIIRNNVPVVDDGALMMCVWNHLNGSGIDLTALKFNRSEIIRLLAHSIFGYPQQIDEHQTECICKATAIEWNGVALFLTSIDTISNGYRFSLSLTFLAS